MNTYEQAQQDKRMFTMVLPVKNGLVNVSTMRTFKIDHSFFFDKWICLTTTFELCLRTAEFIMITVIM